MSSFNNNKESFQLLPATADSNSGSEISEVVIPSRKKRYRRRLRNNPSAKHGNVANECQCRVSTVSLTLFCSLLVCWLITLTWLAVILHSQTNRLTTDVAKVVAGSQGVPDALQKCHSLSRDLQKNQSQIMDRLNRFSLLLSNFSTEMAEMKNGLHTVQNQIKSSPDLINNPTIVKDLSTSVASFGSQIKDQGATILSLRDQYLKLDSLVNNIISNVTGLTELLNSNKEKIALIEKNFAAEKENILAINNTLSNKFQWAKDDREKDHKLIQNLQEMNKNVSARVTFLEGLCAKDTKQSTGFLFPKQDTKPDPETMPLVQQLSPDLYSNESEISKIIQNPT